MTYPHLRQIFRVGRERQHLASGRVSRETIYGMTSVPPDRGTPQQLLGWNRGHWAVENQNHRVRDVQFAEDACLSRKGHAALKNALCNCIVIAVILSSGQDIADGQRHFSLHREQAFQAVLTACQALRTQLSDTARRQRAGPGRTPSRARHPGHEGLGTLPRRALLGSPQLVSTRMVRLGPVTIDIGYPAM